MKTIIDVTSSIIIHNNIETVFGYISNLKNDREWRKEINSTTTENTKPQTGSLAVEDSFLSKRVPSNVLSLQCIELVENHKIVYQTLSESAFFLKSTRQVDAISANETKITYRIEFDKGIAKHGLGFSLPTFLVNYATRSSMKKYLLRLKEILESARVRS